MPAAGRQTLKGVRKITTKYLAEKIDIQGWYSFDLLE
jgi:hypothetical protein